MSSRPEHIDVPPITFSDAPSITSSHSDIPRTPGFADIPPALSPLDALALQGRLLQRRFEEEVTHGRRLSRLPANVVANEIAKARPTYFRSLSQNDVSQVKEPDLPLTTVTQVPHHDRPVSQYPLVQGGFLAGPLRQDSFGTPRRMPSPLNEISEHYSDHESVISEPIENSSFSPSRFPPSPRPGHQARSPSITSESSLGGRPRPSFNFSRPLSRGTMRPDAQYPDARTWRSDSNASSATRPSMDTSFRFNQASGDAPAFLSRSLEDLQRTPNESVTSEEPQISESEGLNGSYIYSTYILPRGKKLNRESLGPQDFVNQQISWNRASRDQLKTVLQNSTPTSASPVSSSDNLAALREKSRPADVMVPIQRSNTTVDQPVTRRINHKPTTSSPSTLQSDASTIRPETSSNATSPATTSADEHFQKGIECHEKDLLQESTYHFRIAARAGHSKAMLFYALACRHGWGIKPNPQEGVIWLQKAVDSSQLEIADDEDLLQRGQQMDLADRKSHKAQFALSVYELGVSYMKGWGVQQDKALALRCFEIAGNWGDVDALAEAGFCYVEGIGCKKDMRKAAGLYRQAEAKGMSMAGNSWIYKEKYMTPSPVDRPNARSRDSPRSDKRSKSRTRNFFGRKKSMVS